LECAECVKNLLYSGLRIIKQTLKLGSQCLRYIGKERQRNALMSLPRRLSGERIPQKSHKIMNSDMFMFIRLVFTLFDRTGQAKKLGESSNGYHHVLRL